MPKNFRRLSPPLVLLATIGQANGVHAQVDVSPPRPNVLLLVDSSGSMEYKTGATTLPTCVASGEGSEKSRWIDLVEVLTGPIPSYRCETIHRNSLGFKQEYALNGAAPVDGLNPRDYLYPVPYHRPMSGACSPTPDQNNGQVAFCSARSGGTCSTTCAFPTIESGLLDAFSTEVRFGLMTFDTLPDPSKDMAGTWSYIVGQPAQGAPKDCSELKSQEVGARNASAPMWEGRMVAFGPPDADSEVETLRTRNHDLQNILLATRPFGATPIAGLLRDARDFFWTEDGENFNGDKTMAPKNDPYSTGKCRSNFAILLTDGEPNMDLRPDCEGYSNEGLCGKGTDACCPFSKAADYAKAMASATTPFPIKTYVIGFAVSDITDKDGKVIECQNLSESALIDPDGLCSQSNPPASLKTCCTLNRIAYEGDTGHAYFASTVDALRAALAKILSEAVKGTTSRTFPVFASAAGSSGGSSTFRFYTSFQPKIDGSSLWQGIIERQRYECVDGKAVQQTVDESKGDNFVVNVNKFPTARTFHSVKGTTIGTNTIESAKSIRMAPPSDDGVGTYSGSQITGDQSKFPGLVVPEAMNLSNSSCQPGGTSAADCRDRYLKWLVGDANGTNPTRCTNGVCNLVADVYHSVPAVVGAPRESLRDEGYLAFSRGAARTRPIVLYSSTNDGVLHAFKVASNVPGATDATETVRTLTNNELWAFIPPAVLPQLPNIYPNVHRLLLDGAPIVRDVPGSTPKSGATIFLERNMQSVGASTSDWRTILVQSFGSALPGYFALDVTDPIAGPKFLWQLTTDSVGEPLFGNYGGTPTITTLYFDPDGNTSPVPREIPVAILPGGDAPPTGGNCARNDSDAESFAESIRPNDSRMTALPCYADAAGKRAKSLSIVRLDNGRIIRTFRRQDTDAPASIRGFVGLANLTSPITGQPVAYPGWTGAIADRAFVGDRDGNLWRLDLSSVNPSAWTMKLFFDAYKSKTGKDGQPIATTPIVSTDPEGRVVVLYSTGNQEDLMGTSNSINYVYSLTETAANNYTATVTPAVNWYLEFTGGKRVAGPMTLFASNAYFATYTPPKTDSACDAGSSSIWGMDFVSAEGGDPAKGGKGALPEGGAATATKKVQEIVPDGTLIAKDATIFGVGVAQIQSCYTTGDSITDPYYGQQYSPVKEASPASYELVVQTGKGGSSSANSSTNVATIGLPQPSLSPRVNSWALVME